MKIALLNNNAFVQLSVCGNRVVHMWRHLACYMFIMTKFASHHFLLYVVYMCRLCSQMLPGII